MAQTHVLIAFPLSSTSKFLAQALLHNKGEGESLAQLSSIVTGLSPSKLNTSLQSVGLVSIFLWKSYLIEYQLDLIDLFIIS